MAPSTNYGNAVYTSDAKCARETRDTSLTGQVAQLDGYLCSLGDSLMELRGQLGPAMRMPSPQAKDQAEGPMPSPNQCEMASGIMSLICKVKTMQAGVSEILELLDLR
jgi:hypothetical protein